VIEPQHFDLTTLAVKSPARRLHNSAGASSAGASGRQTAMTFASTCAVVMIQSPGPRRQARTSNAAPRQACVYCLPTGYCARLSSRPCSPIPLNRRGHGVTHHADCSICCRRIAHGDAFRGRGHGAGDHPIDRPSPRPRGAQDRRRSERDAVAECGGGWRRNLESVHDLLNE